MKKEEIAAILNEIHVLLELQGENPFKVRAYETAARALEALDRDLGEIIEGPGLESIKGVGKALAEKIETLHSTGRLQYYEDLKASIKVGLIEMLDIPGLGPKKIKAMRDKLGITSIEELEKACNAGKVAELDGFGEKTQEKILVGIKNKKLYGQRHLWWKANELAQPILEELKKLPEVKKAELAGSLRRKLETIGDLDFLVASSDPKPIMKWFVERKEVIEILAHGETKSSVRLEGGMQADLRVVPVKQFYFALHHFTGSKDHNVQMRSRALSMGYSLSEWGLKLESRDHELTEIMVKSEEELFKKLKLSYIDPELREGMGEIECAEKWELPELIEAKDIRGVFHTHTVASDGRATLEAMVKGAQDFGWDYLGIADHSKASVQANGLNEERLLEQIKEIKHLNDSKKYKVYVFSGIECDILKNGSLDFEDEILKQLDYVVVSVHSPFGLDEVAMTKRIIKAIENPYATMLGHLTGRILLQREGYRVNVQKVIDAAIANDVIIELNSNPKRLDMDWRYWHKARDKGLKCSINPDAHSVESLGFFIAGINIARKGWLRKEDVINTRGLREIRKYLK
ncbi:MAG: DNA polymerase/3'-5' exonuclease PolX [Verrucomicrobia bacterium]|nr:MAG: DNA polymerase/3'-5' exonuclease PolX [Verrucomicrobiota bacterium]